VGFRFVALLTTLLLLLTGTGCDLAGDESVSHTDIYPMYIDNNGNGTNDYVEMSSHDGGAADKVRSPSADGMPSGSASAGHAFVDENGDGICDYAQNGSATWHGPGFVDEDGDGRPDYWQPGGRGHGGGHHGGRGGM
jgi:hypothetical protein